jgi:hypothetical protein
MQCGGGRDIWRIGQGGGGLQLLTGEFLACGMRPVARAFLVSRITGHFKPSTMYSLCGD